MIRRQMGQWARLKLSIKLMTASMASSVWPM
eukprot:CAMPEP_0174342604 /NCGR_PEP_ID=MMETSP0810-20121108/26303_1 /TAXON_ID=73025 ORGANISM="Eutreptiella gymnastica-like, Strain CCMP1594" /NCGR_SAMPLE_ID=MMETSP0810 /ASSEMBLY_ACC=CAM_ASM_000659 /LENGTH=30 /DNA_ID= /DNA_START= /DNA_END= /DNA_ORIENTATION=